MNSYIKNKFKISDKSYADELWKQSLIKIKLFYNTEFKEFKGKKFVDNFESDKGTQNFLNRLELFFKIEVGNSTNFEVKQDINYKSDISGQSLYNNYLKTNKLSTYHRTPLETFSLFLGYKSYDEFKEKNFKNLLPFPFNYFLNFPNASKIIVFILITLLGIGLYLKTGTPSDEQLREFIIKANKTEFDTYKKLPIIDTLQIDKFWTKSGIAKNRIVKILKAHKEKGKVLLDTMRVSSAKITNFKVIFKTRYYIKISTEEHWKLQWYNKNTHELYPQYDRVDSQFYILYPCPTGWKIEDNGHIKKKDEIIIN